MSKVVFLDTGVLGFVTHPASKIATPCTEWLLELLEHDVRVCFAEICDYELRRKLLHIESLDSLAKLDALKNMIDYVPIDTRAVLRAAELWADARKQGQATAGDKELDGDVIQAAQALMSIGEGDELIIATDNVGHLGIFATAIAYADIHP